MLSREVFPALDAEKKVRAHDCIRDLCLHQLSLSQGSDILRRETLQLEHAKSTRASLLTEVLDKKVKVSLRSPWTSSWACTSSLDETLGETSGSTSVSTSPFSPCETSFFTLCTGVRKVVLSSLALLQFFIADDADRMLPFHLCKSAHGEEQRVVLIVVVFAIGYGITPTSAIRHGDRPDVFSIVQGRSPHSEVQNYVFS